VTRVAARPSGLRRLLSISRVARRGAVYKGLFGGQRGWLAFGGLFWAGRALKKVLVRQESYVTTERLEPGERITLTAIAPPTRAERKAARRDRGS
jgi:hypothetical protein